MGMQFVKTWKKEKGRKRESVSLFLLLKGIVKS
jgi:hypothetical protein